MKKAQRTAAMQRGNLSVHVFFHDYSLLLC